MADKIGLWVRRERRATRWHRVESMIADDAITACGRRLSDEPTVDRGGLRYASDPPDETQAAMGETKCEGCLGAAESASSEPSDDSASDEGGATG